MEIQADGRANEELEIIRLIEAAEACMKAAAVLQTEAGLFYRDAQLRRQALRTSPTEVNGAVVSEQNVT